MYFALKYKLNETWNRIVIFDEISKLTSFIDSIEYLRFNRICPVVSCDVSTHLLGRDLVCRCPHVDLLVGVHTGDDEEHAGPPGSPWQQPAQPEDDRALVFLDKRHLGSRLSRWWHTLNFVSERGMNKLKLSNSNLSCQFFWWWTLEETWVCIRIWLRGINEMTVRITTGSGLSLETNKSP